MQQIADWLEKLGMSEYAERFSENKIDVSVLRHLTDQDLKDIGVALGHRRKILAAIAEFAAATATEPKFFEVYGWFTEGFDTLDLQEAKALLDELQT
jgi:uncharacterized protein YjiS (DUF1127 family)